MPPELIDLEKEWPRGPVNGVAHGVPVYGDAGLVEKEAAAHVDLAALSISAALEREETRLEQGVAHIPTGFSRLDARLGGGLAVPSLAILGAPPKSAKSTWAQIVAVRHVEAGGVAVLIDLENGRRRVLRQILCRRANLGPSEAARALANERAGVFTTRAAVERWRAAKAWVRDTLGPRLFVLDAPPHDLLALVAAARLLAGTRKLLIVVDSLQKLPPGDTRDDRRTAIDKWIRLLEGLRRDYEAVVLAISEIRRGREGYAAREDAFKESGGIEYAADLAMVINRPAADEDEEAVSTLRVELARDSEEDPRGEVASYRAVRPFYGLEEIDPVAIKRSGRRGPSAEKSDGARDYLEQLLASGPVKVSEAIEQGAQAGFSRATLYRAREALGVAECTVNLKKGWRLP